MNARQKCKKLKQRNKLLMDIVTANPEFLRIFDSWTNTPFEVKPSNVRLQEYAVTYPVESIYGDAARKIAEAHIVDELSHAMRENIEWKIIARNKPFMELEGRIRIAETRRAIE